MPPLLSAAVKRSVTGWLCQAAPAPETVVTGRLKSVVTLKAVPSGLSAEVATSVARVSQETMSIRDQSKAPIGWPSKAQSRKLTRPKSAIGRMEPSASEGASATTSTDERAGGTPVFGVSTGRS